jgi:aspartyl-tRNA(Asn)/glutamyl-tRNA(Gln) amidotransferase subunit C
MVKSEASSSMDVAYVARLAHIRLTEQEEAVFGKQLASVLAYMDQLAELDLDGIEPTSHGLPAGNRFRDDALCPGLEREAALANAPARTLTEFKVPKIVE